MQQYELQKEFEKQEKLKTLDEDNRKQYEDELRKQKEKHNQHERVHHPGNKAQLEEVWEKEDHMDPADFQPKPFFMLHGKQLLMYKKVMFVNAKYGSVSDKKIHRLNNLSNKIFQIWTVTVSGMKQK